jgi:hypothetical protein
MHNDQNPRIRGLAAVLWLALPFAGGCGTEVDGHDDAAGAAAAAPSLAGDALSMPGATCSVRADHLACAATAMMDCVIHADGAAQPMTVSCCGIPQDDAGFAVVSCGPAASRGGGVVWQQDDPEETR